MRNMLSLILFFCCANVLAFDEVSINYTAPGSEENKVRFQFNGKEFKPPLNILQASGAVRNEKYQKFQTFFKTVYEKNLEGSSSSILSVWHPNDREEVNQLMDDASLKKNQDRFKAIDKWQMIKIVQYGDYYICFVAMEIKPQPAYVIKYPVIGFDGELYLTNSLNGNYFYDMISHYLDETNFSNIPN